MSVWLEARYRSVRRIGAR